MAIIEREALFLSAVERALLADRLLLTLFPLEQSPASVKTHMGEWFFLARDKSGI